MTELIRLNGVIKHFGENHALDGVDLALDSGEIVGFIGPNGAGKSTCLRICVGIMRRDRGEARVLGMDPSRQSVAIRKRCSYLPGETSMYRNSTGRQFLEYAFGGYRERSDIVASAPELFDLPLKHRIREYSAGMKQRLALRATLCVDVDLYILDEPDRALDATARTQLRDVLNARRAEGKGVLLSSHHLAEVEAIADRSVFILDGHCIPEAAIDAARRELLSEVRLTLAEEIPLPDGTERVERLPNGSVRVRTVGDPFEWLARLPKGAALSVEIGATRLEDLYRMLTESQPESTS